MHFYKQGDNRYRYMSTLGNKRYARLKLTFIFIVKCEKENANNNVQLEIDAFKFFHRSTT